MYKKLLYQDDEYKVEIDFDMMRFLEILHCGSFQIPKNIFSTCLTEEMKYLHQLKSEGALDYPNRLKTSTKAVLITENLEFEDEFSAFCPIIRKLVNLGYCQMTPKEREEHWQEDEVSFLCEDNVLDCSLYNFGKIGLGIDFCICAIDEKKENLLIGYFTFGDFIRDVFN